MNKNLKKILSLILVLLLFSGSVSVAGTDADFSMSVNSKAYGFADEEDETLSSGAYLYRIKENSDGEKSASIVKYTGSATDVGVVSVIDNLPVTEILDGAFRDSKAKWVRIFGNDVVIYPEAFSGSAVTNLVINSEKSKLLGLKDNFKMKTLTVNSKQSEISVDGAAALEKVICGGKVEAFSGVSDYYKPKMITFAAAYPNKAYLDIKNTGYRYKKDNSTNEETFYLYADEDIVFDEETGFSYYINSYNGKAVIVGYKGERENVIIPDELGGKPVYEIADGSFKNMLFVRNVVLGKNVKRIGNSTFENCEWLAKITFNDNLEIIGSNTFAECEALREITIPDNVKKIGGRTFYNCGMLAFVIAKGVEEIGSEAFASEDGYTSLATVKFSRKLHTVDYAAFRNCSSLTSLSVSGEDITFIGERAFENTGIRAFTLSTGLKKIPLNAFVGTKLEEITFGEGIERIGGFAKTEVRKINLPSTVKVIEASAFEGCEYLEEIVFPDGLEHIGDKAFYKCGSLCSVNFPDSLITIGESAFALCGKMGNTLTIPQNVTFIGNDAFSQTQFSELYFNAISCNEANGAFNNITTAVIGEEVTRIPDSLFKNCNSLKKAVIPENVTWIGSQAFSYCENLEKISIPDGVTFIGEYAFSYCKKLKEITIPKEITVFDRSVIDECSSLETVYYNAENCKFTGLRDLVLYGDIVVGKESPFKVAENAYIVLGSDVQVIPAYMYSGITVIDDITLPSSVVSIGEEAFAYSGVEEIKLSDNLEKIEKKAFYNTDVRISGSRFPEKLSSIGEQAFRNCDELTEIYIPDNIASIGDYSFCSCYNLARVRMSPRIKAISDFAFAECGRLSEFIWEAETKTIGKDAFRNCKNLTDFDFTSVDKICESSFVGSGVNTVQLGENKNGDANSLSVIEVAAFENCTNFKELNIGGNVTTIKSGAFANCRKLETAVISPSVTDIAADAFDGCEALTICCVRDSYAYEYALDNHIPVSVFTLDEIPAQTYTGKEITPSVTVSLSDEKLVENTDFTLEFSDNINVGTAKILVSGKGKYKGLTLEAEFEISAKSVADITVSPIENQAYTGEKITPEIIVTSDGIILKEGVDYKVEYFNNTEPGTGKVEITGMGNYSGKTSVTFEIVKQTFWQRIVSFFRMIIESIRNFFVSIFR